ncbi:MAG: hypothetical protein IT388_01625 [Nitrospirales bacterium]|nr:hypothetical protein [Nitrospirales bacterium]
MRTMLFYGMALLMLLSLLCSPASALMTGIGVDELTHQADRVVRGVVEKVESYWNEDKSVILTKVAVIVHEHIAAKGKRSDDAPFRVFVVYEGGEADGIVLRVSDGVEIKEGEEVLLFLKETEAGGTPLSPSHRVVGKAQGKYTITDDGMARKGGFSLATGEEKVESVIDANRLVEKIRDLIDAR